ncbi:unnamed protein product [Microthlaspi erraticum]|uniref:RNase H type-1 domain-containing protein n=1 Tax=Microthlaspi erraticum TaxID=1685480 RepID=A0A6D2IEI3_9BRAS|nr:unnamed protein product [Microthlaspi erraticum]
MRKHEKVLSLRAKVERRIAWEPPTSGWMKMNTDGASRGNPGLATAGGVLRDENGRWVHGFALNIGICSAPLAELWGVYYGLCMAWEGRVTRLVVEVDSKGLASPSYSSTEKRIELPTVGRITRSHYL